MDLEAIVDPGDEHSRKGIGRAGSRCSVRPGIGGQIVGISLNQICTDRAQVAYLLRDAAFMIEAAVSE